MEQRLGEEGGGYGAVFSALSSLAEPNEDTAAIEQLLSARSRTGSGDQTMDEACKEQPVTFGGTKAQLDCPRATAIPFDAVSQNCHRGEQ